MQRGNLQDVINTYTQTGERFSERQLLYLFKGTCEAVRAMHHYRSAKRFSPGSSSEPQPRPASGSDDGHEENDMFPQPEGDAEGGYSYMPGASRPDASRVPLVSSQPHDDGDVIFDDEQDATAQSGSGELVPYAHRDLKPG
jgi:serine/threonine kinase 16